MTQEIVPAGIAIEAANVVTALLYASFSCTQSTH